MRLRNGKVLLVGSNNLYYFLEKERRLEHIPLPFPEKSPFFRSVAERYRTARYGSAAAAAPVPGKPRQPVGETLRAGTTGGRRQPQHLGRTAFSGQPGNTWIRAASGFSVYIRRKDSIINFPAIAADGRRDRSFGDIWGFAEDRHGRLWVAGGGGGTGVVNLDTPEQGIVRKYTRKDGT
ncbi:MAG: hypothetical protein H6559_18970 [Lewinellaceae bacterium]|nr:hypothetical protein [Lewinellaceae bacterium]